MPTQTPTNRNASTPRQPNEWDIRKLGCMWQRTKKNSSDTYLTGVLDVKKLRALLATIGDEDIQWVGFSNKQKKEDKHPDVIIYLSEKKEGNAPTAPARGASAPVRRLISVGAAVPQSAPPAGEANDLI